MTHPAAVFVLLAVSLGLAAGACGSPTDPNTERVVGRIDPLALPRDFRIRLSRAGTASLRVVGLSASMREDVLHSADVAIRVLP